MSVGDEQSTQTLYRAREGSNHCFIPPISSDAFNHGRQIPRVGGLSTGIRTMGGKAISPVGVARPRTRHSIRFNIATQDDVARIEPIIADAWLRMGDVYGIPYCKDSVCDMVSETIRDGFVLVGPNSVVGGFLIPGPYNRKFLIAYVQFWNFLEKREAVIFEEWVELARKFGASHVTASSQFPHNRVLRFYEKRGFRPVEVNAILEI